MELFIVWIPVVLGLMSQWYLTRKKVFLGTILSFVGNIWWIVTVDNLQMIAINVAFMGINMNALLPFMQGYFCKKREEGKLTWPTLGRIKV